MKTKITPIKQPLTVQDVKGIEEDGWVSVVFAITLEDLLGCDGIDGLNDYVDEYVFEDIIAQDLDYTVVGCERNDRVLIEVNCDVSEALEELACEESDGEDPDETTVQGVIGEESPN